MLTYLVSNYLSAYLSDQAFIKSSRIGDSLGHLKRNSTCIRIHRHCAIALPRAASSAKYTHHFNKSVVSNILIALSLHSAESESFFQPNHLIANTKTHPRPQRVLITPVSPDLMFASKLSVQSSCLFG